jgi:hypothetical protein
MKLFTLFSLLTLSLSLFAGVTEEQRKYVFDSITPQFKQFVRQGELSGMSTLFHSEYNYIDIYLDTDARALFNNSLSLRIRKRNFGNGIVEYGIQLKSEMKAQGDIRMEVEEDYLNFYNIVYKGRVIKLKDVLDTIFDRFKELRGIGGDMSEDHILAREMDKLNTWLAFKLDAAVEPFQKLNRLTRIKKSDLKTLKPVLIGESLRQRSHIYVNTRTSRSLFDLGINTRSQIDIPLILRAPYKIWVMESSLDTAVFYSLFLSRPPKVIVEYEVENKYRPANLGTELMDRFERGLKKRFKAKVNLDSKYRQSMLYFNKF